MRGFTLAAILLVGACTAWHDVGANLCKADCGDGGSLTSDLGSTNDLATGGMVDGSTSCTSANCGPSQVCVACTYLISMSVVYVCSPAPMPSGCANNSLCVSACGGGACQSVMGAEYECNIP